jgi:hypothetical protein
MKHFRALQLKDVNLLLDILRDSMPAAMPGTPAVTFLDYLDS